MRTICTLLLAFCISISLSAQKYYPASKELDWMTLDVAGNLNFEFGNAFAFDQGIIYLNDSEAAIPVGYRKGEFGMLKINKAGMVKWETRIPGMIFGSSIKEGNIFVLYAPEWKRQNTTSKLLKDLHAAIIHAETGKIVSDKVIYESPVKKYLEARIIKRPSGEFDHVTVRNLGTELRYLKRNATSSTSNIHALFLDNQLSVVKNIEIKTSLFHDQLIGELLNDKGETVIVARSGDNLVSERFVLGSDKSEKLSAALESDTYIFNEPVLRLDANSSGNAILAIRHLDKKKWSNTTLHFDYAAKKVSRHTQELDKEYDRSIDWIKVDDIMRMKNKEINRLAPTNILETTENIIVIKEMSLDVDMGNNRPTRYQTTGIVFDFYDHQMKLVKQVPVARFLETFSSDGGSHTARILDNKLHFISATLTGVGRIGTLHCIVDLKTFKLEKAAIFDRKDAEFNPYLEGAATLWFGNTVLLNFLKGNWSSMDNTRIQRIDL